MKFVYAAALARFASFLTLLPAAAQQNVGGVIGGTFDLTAGFGTNVAISADGTLLAAGSPAAGAGSVRVYRLSGEAWSPLGPAIAGAADGDEFGRGLAVSADGQFVAIGAPGHGDTDAGQVRVFRFDPSAGWVQVGGDIDDATSRGLGLGAAVAISDDGTRLVAGAPRDRGDLSSLGYVHVYDLVGDTWTAVGGPITDVAFFSQIGDAVAISGDGTTVAGGNPTDSEGSVQVYRLGGTQWELVGETLRGTAVGTRFGYAVSLSADGSRLAVGAPEGGSGGSTGTVDVYGLDGDAWAPVGTTVNGLSSGERFGESVALSPDGAAFVAGAPLSDVGGTDAGSVRRYVDRGGRWARGSQPINGAPGRRLGTAVDLAADGLRVGAGAPGGPLAFVAAYDFEEGAVVTEITQLGQDLVGELLGGAYGYRVSLSAGGTRLAIGVPLDGDGGETPGAVRVYDYDSDANAGGGAWTQAGAEIVGEDPFELFGVSVSLSADGSRLAVGAGDGGSNRAGRTRVYDYDVGGATGEGTWIRVGSDIDGEAGGDQSGASISLSGDGTRLAIGAFSNDDGGDDAGHVRVYAYDASADVGAGAWAQLGADIDGEAAGDYSGWSVSLSADGSTLAVGARFNDGNGSDAGHTRVYAYDVGMDMWRQVGSDIDGEREEDGAGNSVSLSANGERVAIGAAGNLDGGGENAGQVRVYELDMGTGDGSETWVQVGGDIDGTTEDDLLGWSVSLSGDGARLAVGAPINDGSGAGYVQVYDYEAGADRWEQLSPDIEGDANQDLFGLSVSLSPDGGFLACAAPDYFFGDDLGYVRVFALPDNSFGPLPITLTAFAAAHDAPAAVTHVTWATAAERDNAYFLLEHARGAGATEADFATLAQIRGRGTADETADYAYAHADPGAGTHYYRLRQVDADGTETVSAVVAVEVGAGDEAAIGVYPNPARDRVYVALGGALADERAAVTVVYLSGRTVLITEVAAGAPVDVSVLPEGVYGVRVAAGAVTEAVRLVLR